MARPIVAAVEPRRVQLETGREYDFCRCGCSRGQSFCDGSHEGTGSAIKPVSRYGARIRHSNRLPMAGATQGPEPRRRVDGL